MAHLKYDRKSTTLPPIDPNDGKIRVSAKRQGYMYVSRVLSSMEEQLKAGTQNPEVTVCALGHALHVATALSRRVTGTWYVEEASKAISSLEVQEVYEPKEEGLDELTLTKSVPMLQLILRLTSDSIEKKPKDERAPRPVRRNRRNRQNNRRNRKGAADDSAPPATDEPAPAEDKPRRKRNNRKNRRNAPAADDAPQQETPAEAPKRDRRRPNPSTEQAPSDAQPQDQAPQTDAPPAESAPRKRNNNRRRKPRNNTNNAAPEGAAPQPEAAADQSSAPADQTGTQPRKNNRRRYQRNRGPRAGPPQDGQAQQAPPPAESS